MRSMSPSAPWPPSGGSPARGSRGSWARPGTRRHELPMTGRTTHARLTELFAEAIALTPDGRAAFLARLRSDDTELADELSSLLAADAEADTALDTGGLRLTADLRSPKSRAVKLDIPGYRMLAVLGEGGMEIGRAHV